MMAKQSKISFIAISIITNEVCTFWLKSQPITHISRAYLTIAQDPVSSRRIQILPPTHAEITTITCIDAISEYPCPSADGSSHQPFAEGLLDFRGQGEVFWASLDSQ